MLAAPFVCGGGMFYWQQSITRTASVLDQIRKSVERLQ